MVGISGASVESIDPEFWTTFIDFMHRHDKDSYEMQIHAWSETPQGAGASEDLQRFVDSIITWTNTGSLPLSVLPPLQKYFTVDNSTRGDLRNEIKACLEAEHDGDGDGDGGD